MPAYNYLDGDVGRMIMVMMDFASVEVAIKRSAEVQSAEASKVERERAW